MPKIFNIINIDDRNLQTIIDGIRILADPYEKHFAHITVKGPFERKYGVKVANDIIKNKKVEIQGVSNFFEFNQNTVFLKCSSPYFSNKNIWYKKDYEGSNPHLTIYDGKNKSFAKKLYEILDEKILNFTIKVNEISQIQSYKKQFNETLGLLYNYNLLSYYLDESINHQQILDMSEEERLLRIIKLSRYFKKWNNKDSYPSPINNIFKSLDLNEENGLFYFSDLNKWKNKFPFRIIRAVKEIKPYAFYSLLKNAEDLDLLDDHPKPFNQPLLLFFDNPSEEEEERIHRQVFSFGLAPVIFIDKLNGLEIFNGLRFQNNTREKLFKLGSENEAANFSYKKLLSGEAWSLSNSFKSVKKVDEYLLENISQARKILINEYKITPSIANSLIGRLLFVKYLLDRNVEFHKNSPFKGDYFPGDHNARNDEFLTLISKPNRLYEFFDYLNEKLDGDLFPITEEERQTINEKNLNILYYLFKGSKIYNNVIQDSLFHIYDFKVIPIELISNIYEQFIGTGKRFENKAFYTPSFLVDYVLSQTVTPKLKDSDKISCKVLDPSCGSGIFLIETLRKIIEKHLQTRESEEIDNDKLWSLVQENIFGIDIDADAIEVAIFSLYVTVLDYVEPKIIAEDFKFRPLKHTNFFPNADFFDTNHAFNEVLSNVKLDFIVGNPPWGHVKNSIYMEYCNNREVLERSALGKKSLKIEISDKQIAQAFLLRTSDFSSRNTICALVVTSKILYNSNAKEWRNYFLTNFNILEVFELSAVNTKIFNGAKWPSAIIFFKDNKRRNLGYDNVIKHISLKSNKFFHLFKTIIIEKYDYKKIEQKHFMYSKGGHDWLWKVLLYGNVLDYQFLKRLKSNYKTINDLIIDNSLEYGVGLKRKDGTIKKDASNLLMKPFLDTDKKQLRRFHANPKGVWDESYAAAIPNLKDEKNYPILFKGPVSLIKEGLDSGYKGVSAFYNNDIIFTHSVRSIKGSLEDIPILKSIVCLINSDLFAYYIFQTGTSTGIDFIRANQIEQFSFPAVTDDRFSSLNDEIENLFKQKEQNIFTDLDNQITKVEGNIMDIIIEDYNITDIEKDLISYAQNISIPLTKINGVDYLYRNIKDDSQVLISYIEIFTVYFNKRLIAAKKYLKAEVYLDKDFLAINFLIKDLSNKAEMYSVNNCDDTLEQLKSLYNISISSITTKLYIQRDIKGFEKNSFYVVKPNEYKCWHKAIAWIDLGEFIDAIFKSGLKQKFN